MHADLYAKPMRSTSVRIDGETHERLKELAADLGTTVGEAVTVAVRGMRQELIGRELSADTPSDDAVWLDADLG